MGSISFVGRVAIVTGAGGGIGRSYALDIASRGGAVVVNDLGGNVEGEGGSEDLADQVVGEIMAGGGRAIANYDSVATVEGARRIVAAAIDEFGRVDVLINNAGNLRNAPFEESREEDLAALLAVHLIGSHNVTKAAWPYMKRQRYGRVVFTSSSAGMFGNELQCGYAAAKAGVIGLMNVLALEGEPYGILCNAVMPNALGRMTAKATEDMGAEARLRATALVSSVHNSMAPEFNTGLAVYLGSEACTFTHSVYSACAGRIARVFVGVTEGWQGSREMPAAAEEIAENIERIRDEHDGIHIPASPRDEFRIVMSKAGAAG